MINSIDSQRCTGCGTCTKTCSLDVFRLDPDQHEISPCMEACPAGVDIRKNNYLIQQGRLAEAAENFRKAHPFPAITGRVCFHPCESKCSRARLDGAVNINAVEQFLGDFDIQNPVPRPVVRHLEKVAIVGSGPAGLSCAYFLAEKGYPVTVFEAMPEAGGMLRYGIPAYRLPDDVVLAQVERLESMGVQFRYNTLIGKDADLSLDDLKKRGFKAVLLAPGTTTSRKVQMEGIDLPGVFWGLEFLRSIRSGAAPAMKGSVLVIGGGDVAVDAAISARKLGAEKVHMICLEDAEHMPAYPHNQADARAEGIEFHCGFGPVSISGAEKVEGMDFKRCLSVLDAEGRFAPVFEENVSLSLKADAVIFAIGQATELDGFADKVQIERGRITADPITFQSSEWGIFAAGDAVTGPASVVKAIAGGREAAESIDRMLIGADIPARRGVKRPVVQEEKLPGVNILPGKEIRPVPRNERTAVVPSEPFGEKTVGLDMEAGFTEALRCMTCGSRAVVAYTDDCMTCFFCELNCPSDAIFVHPFKERFARTLDQIEPAKQG
ncbi:MAG: FAD-dependent oxidoreductase [Mailhella sp.]|nr:FAD-dependent oxidoreductase [Mailhella sp.]